MAIVAICGFVAGGVFAIAHLRTGERKWDMRSYVSIHLSIVLAVGVLLTGSIWAHQSWGHWFVWNEPMLVVFLIVFLLYATYQPLRFSIEDPERQARYASVFAITAGAFVPLCFGAVRMADNLTHPQAGTMTTSGPSSVTQTFLVSLLGMALLFVTLCKYEMASKNATFKLRSLRRRLAGDDEFDALPTGRSAAPQL
jgi:heme exporter protein C